MVHFATTTTTKKDVYDFIEAIRKQAKRAKTRHESLKLTKDGLELLKFYWGSIFTEEEIIRILIALLDVDIEIEEDEAGV